MILDQLRKESEALGIEMNDGGDVQKTFSVDETDKEESRMPSQSSEVLRTEL